ncbi:MAG: hypothetical protein A2W35_06065 [Chloroflexi bacterium RBG_16_57_11]|nr:MAG: hypothetical protein A2W35_06065 [Chloroflexi bacterium RBG_16_57_11]
MSIHYDDKGKFFTDIILKEAVPVLIQTLTNRIHGNIYVRPGERIKDQINQEDMFLAVTDAIIYDLSGEELYHCDFLLVNRAHLIWLMPEDQEQNQEPGDEGAST